MTHRLKYRIHLNTGGKWEVWLVGKPDRLIHVFSHREDAVQRIKDLNGEEIQDGQEGI